MTTRAQRKRARRRHLKAWKVGDVVTWGNGSRAHTITEVTADGVYVDITGDPNASFYASRFVAGRNELFVSIGRNNRSKSGRGPIRIPTTSDLSGDPVGTLRRHTRRGF